jgi:outer membrane protein assembly factor BamB
MGYRMIRFYRAAPAVLALAALLAGCDAFDSDTSKTKLPGERISVLQTDEEVKPDERIANDTVHLPQPWINHAWPESGGLPDHAMQHLDLGDNLKQAWRVSIGSGSDGDVTHLMSTPIVDHGRVYTIDTESTIKAFDVKDGSTLWRTNVAPPGADVAVVSGAISIGGNRIYVATGFAQVVALDIRNGREIWRQNMPAPLRAAATFSDDKLFVVTVDNSTVALSATDGTKLWTQSGINEAAGLLGGASPAFGNGIVISPYSSGELFALRSETGRIAWSENLTAVRRVDAVSAIADIRARPVVDRGMVFAISHSGRIADIDLRTGERIWDREIPGEQQPWVAGDFLYVLSIGNELYCLTRDQGLVRWSTKLPEWEDEEAKEDAITWAGPVLAGDRLIVTGSDGSALSISPYTGEILGRQTLSGRTSLPAIVADRTLYILTDDGDLAAYR